MDRILKFRDNWNRCNLMDAGYVGRKFTWTRQHQGRVILPERLDILLYNIDMVDFFPNLRVITLTRIYSDHNLILVNTDLEIPMDKDKRPFRFEVAWLTHEEFKMVFNSAWDRKKHSLVDAVEEVKNVIISWKDSNFGNIFKRKKTLAKRLQGIQRSPHYFHSNFLQDLEKVLDYEYQQVLTQKEIFWFIPRLNEEEKSDLSKQVTMEEVKEELFTMKGMKAPGPDDIQHIFYKQNWDTVKNALCDFANMALELGKMDTKILRTFLEAFHSMMNLKGQANPEQMQHMRNCLYEFSQAAGVKVASFIDENRSWNIREIQHLISEETREEIKRVPIPILEDIQEHDKISWGFAKDGKFTVNSAYQAITNMEIEGMILAKSLGLRNVILEMDAKWVVDLFKGENMNVSVDMGLINECINILKEGWVVEMPPTDLLAPLEVDKNGEVFPLDLYNFTMDKLLPMFLAFVLFVFMVFKLRKRSKTKDSPKKLPPSPWKLPLIGHLHHFFFSLPHRRLMELSERYGPVMHLKLGELSHVVVSSVEAAKEVMNTHDIKFANRPYLLAAEIILYNCSGIASASYGASWRQLRKFCTLELFISNVCNHSDQSENSSTLMTTFTGRCKRYGAFFSILTKLTELGSGFSIVDMFPSVKLLPVITGMRSKLERLHPDLDAMLESIIEEHRASNAKPKKSDDEIDDLVDVLLNLQDHGGSEIPLTTDNIKAVILVSSLISLLLLVYIMLGKEPSRSCFQDLLMDGTESPSIIIEWAMSEIIKNPAILKKAQAEVRQVYDRIGNVDESKLDELKYLKLVVKETLRLHPPGPLLLPRENNEKCEINGYEIPAKTSDC
ncbi:hypothetical protein F3Y22_tig00110187pilonHSYRG00428 [Hibiscus syriacus]|uniref:Cytochrome P450 n=1 Tax=Hibiscus syriacus TaxID=106335 RepID=A0A6A3BEH9_HIBSY|nr:hypothetical protein F3Y22_tig00110187pilonHSYRG00428 [Hibiscus syriacus]